MYHFSYNSLFGDLGRDLRHVLKNVVFAITCTHQPYATVIKIMSKLDLIKDFQIHLCYSAL